MEKNGFPKFDGLSFNGLVDYLQITPKHVCKGVGGTPYKTLESLRRRLLHVPSPFAELWRGNIHPAIPL